MTGSRPTQVRFGPFVCDASTGELWKAGRPIKLQEQPRQLLVALLEQPGEVLSRDQLRRRLWTDDTFVDFDNALNVGVRRIREALGDDAPTARYVETVRGRGYRFIAPVSVAHPAPVPAPVTDAAAAAFPVTAAPSRRQRTAAILIGTVAAVAAALAMARSATSDQPIAVLAVLPFENLLADDDQQYVVDGLSEAISQRLAARLDVRVIAQQSARAATEHAATEPDIAERLGADVLLVGSIAKAGAGVVVNARLVDGRSGRTRWAGRLERSLSEPTLPDDIVDAVAGGIGITIQAAPARAAQGIAPEARDAYLRGRFFWAKRGEANSVTAVRYLSTAIQLQPDYADAWAGLADVYAVYGAEPSPVIVPWPGNSVDGGLHAAREALRLVPDFGEAHASLGKLYVAQRRWAEAEQAFAKAVTLSPQYSTARQWYGTMFLRLRRCDEALEQVAIAVRLDPLTVLVNEALGSVYLGCGEPWRAIEVFDAILVMHPTAHTTRHRRAVALSRLARYDEAIDELEALAITVPGDAVTGALAVAHAKAGRDPIARTWLAHVTSPFVRAQIFAALGDTAGMWPMLEQSLAGQGGALQNLLSEAEFERYRDDPRFVDFARRAGFPLPIRDARFSAQTDAAVTAAGTR
jgi:DNA-binding winged helix-turn-helix (wHTH) protein/TolB-like protein/Tfp pilus assembly protein PilF